MIVLHGLESTPPTARGAVLAIGNFDGVHRGHQALLKVVMTEGRRLGRPAGALVFEPHPREFFQPDKPHFQLTPLRRKLVLLEQLGLDIAVVLPFDANLASLSAEAFIDRIIVGALGAAHIVIGYDFRFGKDRKGDPEMLKRAGDALGFGVTVVPQIAEAGEVFSSSAIRAELAQGDVAGAANMLGHWWRVGGRVVGGAKRGTGMGFPTANLLLPRGTTLGHAIYAVRVYIDGERYLGAAYLGRRPTFDNGEAVLEVFLFDFDADLYGREIDVEFVDIVRGDAKFDSMEALKQQMTRDCERAREILEQAPAQPLAFKHS
jgi:riboflavin kinase / FMN adenylyltransferase